MLSTAQFAPQRQPNQNPGLAGNNGVAVSDKPNASFPAPKSFEELEIPDQLRLELEKELTTNERLLWLGRPSPNLAVQIPRQVFLFASIGLMVVGLAIVAIGGLHVTPIVFGGAFGVFGLVLLVPWLKEPMKWCSHCYAVTNTRAIVIEIPIPHMPAKINSYLPHQLAGMERRDHAKVPGAGDLIMEYKFDLPGKANFNMTTGFMNQKPVFGRSDVAQRVPYGFFAIEQVRSVERLIRTVLLGEIESAIDDHQPDMSAAFANCVEEGQIPAEVKEKALAGLDATEKVVWIAQPHSTLLFVRGLGYLGVAVAVALIAFVWIGISLLPQKVASDPAPNLPQRAGKAAPKQVATNKNAPVPQPAQSGSIMLPVVLLFVSLGLVAVPLVRGYNGRRSLYALTNRRALVYRSGLFGPTRESYSPLEVSQMRRRDSWLLKGSGDLIFRTVHVVSTARTNTGLKKDIKTTNYGLLGVKNVREVEKLVRETLIEPFVGKLQQANLV